MTATAQSFTPPLLRWSWGSVLIITAIWTALALLSVGGAVVTFQQIGRPIEWRWLTHLSARRLVHLRHLHSPLHLDGAPLADRA